MVTRFAAALVGALVITAGLLLAMDSLTSLFRERDAQRYYRITDILPKVDTGRPDRPAPLRRQPGIASPGFDSTAAAGGLESAPLPEPANDIDPALLLPEPALPPPDITQD